MAENTNDTGREFDSEKETGATPQSETGQQPEQSEFGQSGNPLTGTEDGTSPADGGEFTGHTETSLADRTGQQDGGIEGTGGEGDAGGFVGSQGEESGDYLQQDEQGSKDQDFVEQGRGATDEDEESGDSGNSGSI